MLQIFKKLVYQLNSVNCTYCIYKGLDHLYQDLNGERGDIDIVVKRSDLDAFEKAALGAGFYRAKNFIGLPKYYFGKDYQTGKILMLDVVTSIELGVKPVKIIKITPDWSRITFDIKHGLRILSASEYLPLTLMLRLSSQSPEQSELGYLKDLINNLNRLDYETSFFGEMVKGISALANKDIYDMLKISQNWGEMQLEYKKFIYSYFLRNIRARVVNKIIYYSGYGLRKAYYLVGRLTEGPMCRIRNKGQLVAFIGVDGAGKSTIVDNLMANEFNKRTGIKRIYFGGGEFWIPGVVKLNGMLSKIPLVHFIPKVLMNFDRKARLYIALFYKRKGYIVVCDRYFYDDEINREMALSKIYNLGVLKSFLMKIQMIFKPRLTIKPDVTIFLDVSPEVAYGRKQDFSFEKMLDVNLRYKNYMKKHKEVIFIDADETQEVVQNAVCTILNKLEYDKLKQSV